MAIKTYKPTTPSRRHMTVSAFEGIDKKANPGPIIKRIMPRAQGRAYRINKRTSHVTIAVSER